MSAILQAIEARPRLFVSILVGAGAGLAFPSPSETVTRLLVAWNGTVWVYLALAGWLMARATHERVRRIAEREDKGAAIILATMSLGAIASVAAILLELATARSLPAGERLAHYAFTGATLVGSWCLLATLFTFHYARTYYRSPVQHRALRFPEQEATPDYWDFLYFSFTIAVAAQTSDVSVVSRSMRRIVLAQSVLSFFFNFAILGLSINIAAGLVGV
jgi:uncharacterized membrane protein